VEAVAKAFQGAYFDGMTDYKGSNYNTLDGQAVRFGADFIFVNRKFTAPTLTGIVVQVCNYYGFDNEILIDDGNSFGAYIKAVGANADSEARGFTAYDIDRIIRDACSKYSTMTAPKAPHWPALPSRVTTVTVGIQLAAWPHKGKAMNREPTDWEIVGMALIAAPVFVRFAVACHGSVLKGSP
jgi:hypothetical protein